MSTPAFEAFKASQKKAQEARPADASFKAPARKVTPAFEEFQASKTTKKESPVKTLPADEPNPLTPPKSSSDFLTQAPITNTSVAASDAMVEAIPSFLKSSKTGQVVNIIHDQVKAYRKNAITQEDKAVGALLDTAIDTAKDVLYRMPKAIAESKNPFEFGITALNWGANLATLGALDFALGAAPEVVGAGAKAVASLNPVARTAGSKQTGAAVETGVRYGMEKLLNDLLYEGVGGAAVDVAETATGEDLSPSASHALKGVMTFGVLGAGFKAAAKVGDVRAQQYARASSASDMIVPMAETLGVRVARDANGRAILPDENAILRAHKEALTRAADDGGNFVYAKMDAYDVAREMLLDFKRLSPGAFDAKWRQTFEGGSRIAREMEAKIAVKEAEMRVAETAKQVSDVLYKPATRVTRKKVQELTTEGQFAFEQALVDMGKENDGKLLKQAQSSGYAYERTTDPFDNRPAYYDALTNKIVLNEDMIRYTLDRVWSGEVIKMGEGKTTTIFRKGAKETFEQMKNRYEKVLVDHEMAHAKTITPEDVARLRSAVGDQKKLEKIRTELEDKANVYAFERANDLDAETNAAIDRTVLEYERSLNYKDLKEGMKFPDAEREASYQRWKNIVRRNKDYALSSFDELKAGLEKSPSYKGKKVESLFNDALDKGTKSASKGDIDSFDKLIDSFQERYKRERKLAEQQKRVRDSQQKLLPGKKRDPAVEKAVRRMADAQLKADKLEGKASKLDTKLLRERVTRRLEKQVLKEKGEATKAKMRESFREAKEVQKGKSAAREGALKSKASMKREAQQALVDYMREAKVPNEVRGKFVAQLKNARNADDAVRVVERIQKEWNVYKRREAVARITETLNNTKVQRTKSGAPVGKLTAKVQKDLDFVRKIAKEDRNALNTRIVQIVDETRAKMAKEGNVSLELPPDVAHTIELLELGGIKGQTVTELKHTEARIQSMIEEARGERKAVVAERRDATKDLQERAMVELTGKSERPKAVQEDTSRKKDSWIKSFYNSSALLQDLSRQMGGIFETMGNALSQATNRAIQILNAEDAAMRRLMAKAYGENWEAEIVDFANNQYDLGSMTDKFGDTVEVRVTRGRAMDVYLRMQESGTGKFITEADSYKDANGDPQKAGLGYTQEMVDKITSILTPADKAVADWLVSEGYASWYKKLAPVFEKRTGTPLGEVDRFAGTRKWERGAEIAEDVALGIVQDMMETSTTYKLSTTPGFVKTRVAQHGNIRLSDNPILDYMVYAKRASHYIEVGDAVNQWRGLLSSKDVRISIVEKYGDSFLEALQFHVDSATRGGFPTNQEGGATRLFAAIQGNVSSALLFNPRVWLGQLSAPAAFKAEMALLPGKQSDFNKGLLNSKQNAEALLRNAPALSARLNATPSELIAKFAGEKGALPRVSRFLEKVREKQAIPIEKFDAIASLRGASGIFEAQKNYYLSQGFDLAKAEELAGADVDNVLMRTQSTRQYTGKSQIEAGALRFFVALKQQPTKIFRGNIEAGKLLRQKRITPKQFASFFVWNNVVQPVAYVALRKGASLGMGLVAIGAYQVVGTEDAEKKARERLAKDFSGKGIAEDVAVNMFQNITNAPIIGDVLSTALQNSLFEKSYEFRPSLIQAVADDVIAVLEQASDGDYDESLVYGARLVSRMTGVGDPIDAFKWILPILSTKNKERKLQENRAQ